MRFDVKLSKDADSKRYWAIYGQLPNQTSAVGLFESGPHAYPTQQMASDAAWKRIGELEGRPS